MSGFKPFLSNNSIHLLQLHEQIPQWLHMGGEGQPKLRLCICYSLQKNNLILRDEVTEGYNKECKKNSRLTFHSEAKPSMKLAAITERPI